MDDADPLRDNRGGQWMVACDHHRPDARRSAHGHRLCRFGAGRVHHADHADENHAAFRLLRSQGIGNGVPYPHGKAQGSQTVAGDFFGRFRDVIEVERFLSAVAESRFTALQNFLNRSLGKGNDPAVFPRMERGHELAVRIKGNFRLPGIPFIQPLPVVSFRVRQIEERRFGGITDERV